MKDNDVKENENPLNANEVNIWKRMYFNRRFISEKSNSKVLYVHIPFCKSKCKYCVYSSNVPQSLNEMETFVKEVLPNHIRIYNDVLNQVSFEQVYFGGGTPTILAPKQLEEIFDNIPLFASIPNKCIEASPTTLTSEHIKLFESRRFNFLSLGIQSLDNRILRKYGRPIVSKERLVSLCKEINMTGIFLNLDLICYLDKGDIRDLPRLEEDIRYILDNLHPSSITIHQHYQSFFTSEKTFCLVEILKKITQDYPDYSCANSSLEMDAEEILTDTYNQAEYRLVINEQKDYRHYMWDKYATLPVQGYDILSIGYTSNCHTTSNVNKMIYVATNDTLVYSV